MMTSIHILRDETGAAAIEAAFALPFYFAFIFCILELGNIYWNYTSIQYVADEIARCSVVSNCSAGTTAFNSAANVWSSAATASSDITVSANTTCGNYTGTKVTITHSITSLTGYFPSVMPSPFNKVAVQSCYPNAS